MNSTNLRNHKDDHTLSTRYEVYDRMGLRKMIRSDLMRWERSTIAICKLGFYSALFYRLSRFFALHNMFLPAGIMQFLSHLITGAEISNKAVIGPGLMILHPTGVHIGPRICIGSNATICENCSVVTNPEVGEGQPTIGDNLWASAGSRIMGPVVLGDRVWVGPNSVILKDVGSNMTAFGIPARIMPRKFRRTHLKSGRASV